MLFPRIITALLLLGILVPALWFLTTPWLMVILTIIASLTLYEWLQVIQVTSKLKQLFSLLSIVVFVYFSLINTDVWLLFASCGLWLGLALVVFSYPSSKSMLTKNILWLITPLIFSPILVGCYWLLENLPKAWLLFGFALVWVTDSFAYIGGKLFGKHKLMIAVSPNKTIEGAMFGIAAGMLVGYGFYANYQFLSISNMVAVTIITIFAAIIGDLTESMIKRQFACKDSGKLLPGHGGFLDRNDGLLAAIPVYVVLLRFFIN